MPSAGLAPKSCQSVRLVTITLHGPKSGLLEIWCKATDMTLHAMEFYGFCTWIKGWSKIGDDAWTLKQLDINIDGIGYRLAGELKSITMGKAKEWALKIYEKGNDVRVEAALAPKETTMSEAMGWLHELLGPATAIMKEDVELR